MVFLLIFVNMFMLISVRTVWSLTCPACANVKSECAKSGQTKTMDCTTLKIDNEDPKKFVKEPTLVLSLIEKLKEMDENKEKWKLKVGCIDMNYALELTDANLTSMVGIDPKTVYTLKSCMFENDKMAACDWVKDPLFVTANFPTLDDVLKMNVKDCKFNQSSRLSVSSHGLVMFGTFAVLLKIFV